MFLPLPEGAVVIDYIHPITGETARWIQVRPSDPEPRGLIEDGYIRITDVPCDSMVEEWPIEAAPLYYHTMRQ